MYRCLLSKIQELQVTEANVNYKGSITLCPKIMDKANINEFQEVEVNSKHGQSRIKTYVIRGRFGDCKLNGGAANFFTVGELVHINAYGLVKDISKHKPTLI